MKMDSDCTGGRAAMQFDTASQIKSLFNEIIKSEINEKSNVGIRD